MSENFTPLAEAMRPKRIEQFVGQEHLVGPHGPIRQAIVSGKLHSFVLWGPPGSGKTTLARIVAFQSDCEFVALSAVSAGVKELREVVAKAEMIKSMKGRHTLVFIDEIHRFNKTQQDALLPHVEDGTILFAGATTENPSFSLNSALLSRVAVYILNRHSEESIKEILLKSLQDKNLVESLDEKWIHSIGVSSQGDARRALGMLERYVQNPLPFSEDNFKKVVGYGAILYDRTGEQHYNMISAFIKSMRDTDPDGAIYYLARMLEGGEDPVFIARRLVIFASEDVGNADPRALSIAVAAQEATKNIGMPECRINLAQAVTFLASAPKSNASYVAIDEALAEVRRSGPLDVPMHLRNAPTGFMKSVGYGDGYKYAHDEEGGNSFMKNLPEPIKNRQFYRPKQAGLEIQIAEKLAKIKEKRTK